MANTFFLEIITPYKKFFSEDVEMLVLSTPEGEIGILKDHMPMVTEVSIGSARIKKSDGSWCEAFLSSGFMEINQGEASVLVETAEWPEEIDFNRAKAAADRALERLQNKNSSIDYIRTQAALQRATSRLKVSNKSNGK